MKVCALNNHTSRSLKDLCQLLLSFFGNGIWGREGDVQGRAGCCKWGCLGCTLAAVCLTEMTEAVKHDSQDTASVDVLPLQGFWF